MTCCAFFFAAYLRADTLTNVQTVFLILMENHDWSDIRGNTNCPYLNNTLLPIASRAEQYFTPPNLHPSAPNYIWLEAGTNFGILDDQPPAIQHTGSTNHLVTMLEKAGISWKSYQESFNAGDSPLTNNYPYVVRHNPFVFFDDIATNLARCTNHIRPYWELAADLQSNTVARYNFITPNATNDMHDLAPGSWSAEKQGDDWLAREAPRILSSAAYTNNGALFILWDEGDNEVYDGPLGLLVLSPLARGRGYANSIHYTHSSLLRTLQEIFRVGPWLGDAANADDLADLFQCFCLTATSNPTNGLIELTLNQAVPGATNVIEVSSDLIGWLPLRTNRATGDSFHFVDASVTNAGRRFYRALEFH